MCLCFGGNVHAVSQEDMALRGVLYVEAKSLADPENWCLVVDLSLSQDLIHEHIGMETPCFSQGRERKRNSSVCT